jgi:hypothetical protein
MRPRDVVIMATGTQGEPSSVLARGGGKQPD